MARGAAGEAVADARREEMLAAAATLIAERGFADTRIADVARRVGSSPALVVYYFGTKDTLLTEALRWSERTFYSATEEMLRSTPQLRDRLEQLVDWTLTPDKAATETGDWGLWFDVWAQAFRHPQVKQDRAELDARWRDLISRVVHAGVEGGDIARIDDKDIESFAIMWSSLLDGLVVQVALEDPVVTVDRARAIALDVAHQELGLPARRTRRTRRTPAAAKR